MKSYRKELFFDVKPRFFGCFTAPLVNQELLGDLIGLRLVFDEINLQLTAEKFRHGLLDEFVRDGFLRLVFIRGLRGKAIGDENQAVLNIDETDFAFVFLIFVRFFQKCVDLGDKSAFRRLFGCAAMLQPGGIMIVLDKIDLI